MVYTQILIPPCKGKDCTKMDTFRYVYKVDSPLAKEGNLDEEITYRVESGWNDWRKRSRSTGTTQ